MSGEGMTAKQLLVRQGSVGPRTMLKPSKRLEFEEAFGRIDSNGDGRLQKEEIQAVLQFLRLPHSVTHVDQFFENCSERGKNEGLDLPEFLDMMANHDLGVSHSGLAEAVVANSNRIKSQYRTQFSAVLAERNAVKHKRRDVDDDALAAFLAKEDTVCVRCGKKYESLENSASACQYHPEKGISHTGVKNHLDRVKYPCCGRQQIGTSPVLTEAAGCKRGYHEARPKKEVPDPVPNVAGLTLMGTPGKKKEHHAEEHKEGEHKGEGGV